MANTTETKKSTSPSFGNILSQGLMAFGQGMTGQPYYSNYLDSQNKRIQMEREAEQSIREQQYKNAQLMLEKQKLRYKTQGGIPRFMMDDSGNLVQLPGILVETPEQKKRRSVETASEKKEELGAGAEAGRLALAEEAVTSVDKIRNLLFPEGTPESFKRSAALKANIFGKPVPNSKEGQELYRLGTTAIAGRQLLQTGVAARPEETKALMDAFLANIFSNPESTYAGLNQLQDFYNSYMKKSDPKSKFTSSKQMDLTSMSDDELKKLAGL